LKRSEIWGAAKVALHIFLFRILNIDSIFLPRKNPGGDFWQKVAVITPHIMKPTERNTMKLFEDNLNKVPYIIIVIATGTVVVVNLLEKRRREQVLLAKIDEQCNEMVARFEEQLSKISKQ
jgi:hypothetical protein